MGKVLYGLYRGHFGRDIEKMLKVLLDDHPAGWSTIIGEWTEPVSFGPEERPSCYCHGTGSGSAGILTEGNASKFGCEYAYVFDGRLMCVLSSYHRDGTKVIGWFGEGDPEAIWRPIAIVNLDNPEPEWKSMGQGGE